MRDPLGGRSARDLAPGPTMNDGIDTADQPGMISFDRSFDGGLGELVQLSPLVRRMVAGNAGPMTFTGTCTYVVGTGEVAVIDPGPDRPDHIPPCSRLCVARPSRQFLSPTRT